MFTRTHPNSVFIRILLSTWCESCLHTVGFGVLIVVSYSKQCLHCAVAYFTWLKIKQLAFSPEHFRWLSFSGKTIKVSWTSVGRMKSTVLLFLQSMKPIVCFYVQMDHIHSPCYDMPQAVLARLSLRRLGYVPRPDHVRFLMDKAAPRENNILVYHPFLVRKISQMLYSYLTLCVTRITRTSCRCLKNQIEHWVLKNCHMLIDVYKIIVCLCSIIKMHNLHFSIQRTTEVNLCKTKWGFMWFLI
jgi:hypothetical protein